MKTSNTELREEIIVELANHFWEDQRYTANGRFEEVRKQAEEMLDSYLAQSQTNLLDRVEKALPKKKYFEPMGGPVSHAQSEAFNQALTEVRNSLNQIRKELGNG